ncbi:MAG: alanine racemase [Nostocoides sp.]
MSDDETARWDLATAGLPTPLAVVDLAAFDANADDLVRRAGGLPIRVASKSVRCRALIDRVLARPGFAGIMAYAAAEAIWLVEAGHDDVYVAYPTVDRVALQRIRSDERLAAQIALTIDSVEHVDFLAGIAGEHPLRVALDIDASLRVGPVHLGVRRSPLRTPSQATEVARAAVARGLRVVGAMFYDAQVAGMPDSRVLDIVKRRSLADLAERRGPVAAAIRAVPGTEVVFVNGGGTGSLELVCSDPALTELAAGSGLYGPGLFDGYRAFTPGHAAAYAIPVVRRPARGIVTGFSGGYHASGPGDQKRLPSLVVQGLSLIGSEGAGEVQTPVRGRATRRMKLGDRIWLRHAKAGELGERVDAFHLVEGDRVVESVPTYRGEGKNFG